MRLVIFGTGGMGRDAADLVRRNPAMSARYSGMVFAVDDPQGPVDGLEVIGPDAITLDDDLCLAVGNSPDRRRLAERFAGYRFAGLTAATALVSPAAQLGLGAVVMDHCLVNSQARIGAHFQGNVFCQISHDAIVGDFVTMAPRVSCNGWITIGNDVTIGAGALIRNGTKAKRMHIGDGAVLGMGAIILEDVPAGAVMVSPKARAIQGRTED